MRFSSMPMISKRFPVTPTITDKADGKIGLRKFSAARLDPNSGAMCQLNSCPVCGHQLIDDHWIDEQQKFLVECQQCTTFTITKTLIEMFLGSLTTYEHHLKELLSRYLRNAGDEDEREITETSWRQLTEDM